MSTNFTTWLLLLPNPPSDISLPTIRAAYEQPLTDVLLKASSVSISVNKLSLEVAVYCPAVPAHPKRSRTTYYPYAERLVGLLYRVICLVCAERSIDVELGNDVESCVFLIGFGQDKNIDIGFTEGPVVDIESLALSPRAWSHVYSVESEAGESLLQKFVSLRKSVRLYSHPRDFSIQRVTGGTSISVSEQTNSTMTDLPQLADTRHYSIAVGGTFDHLHAGHKLLLTATAALLEPQLVSEGRKERTLVVGITGDDLLKSKKYAECLQGWEERHNAVYQFLLSLIIFKDLSENLKRTERFSEKVPNGRAIHYEFYSGLVIKCVEISDPFGPTITDESITALVISGETRAGGKAVNDKRTSKGWQVLEVYEVDVLDQSTDEGIMEDAGKDFQSKISSTDIRRRLHKRKQPT